MLVTERVNSTDQRKAGALDRDEDEITPRKTIKTPKKTPPKWEAETQYISLVMGKYREVLSCTACGEQNSLLKRGTDSVGAQILKCKRCFKCISGKTVTEMMANQLGEDWREKAGQKSATDGEADLNDKKDDETVMRDEIDERNITVSKKQWIDMINAVEHALKENRSLVIENQKLKGKVQDVLSRIERLETAKNNNNSRMAMGHEDVLPEKHIDISATTPRQVQRGRINNETTSHDNAMNGNRADERGNINTNNERGDKLKGVQITKLHRPAKGNVPSSILENIRHSQKLFEQQRMRVQTEARPTAVYFKNVRKGPIGVQRRVLCECLPGWAILGPSFVGG